MWVWVCGARKLERIYKKETERLWGKDVWRVKGNTEDKTSIANGVQKRNAGKNRRKVSTYETSTRETVSLYDN